MIGGMKVECSMIREEATMDQDECVAEALCEIIGYELLELVCDRLGGRTVYLPKHPPKELRDSRIREEFNRLVVLDRPYMSIYRALATKYSIDERHVMRIVNRRMRI